MIQRMVVFGASGDLTSRLLMPAIAQLAEAGLLPPGFTIVGSANTDWSTDLASARHLNQILRIQLPQPVIFRIDHFLSSELVRRVVTLRFLNRIFEPIWNAVHVERVDISWLESLTLEGRASYYDTAGRREGVVTF